VVWSTRPSSIATVAARLETRNPIVLALMLG
jgi:hypothetical protein